MAGVLEGGFELNGIKYEEPNNIITAFGVAGDVVISASGQQYGGFTVSEMDKVMKKYAERTYQSYKKMFLTYEMDYDKARKMAFDFTLRDIKKGYKAFEVKIGTIGNSLGQTPFTTVTFGLDTDFWGREISKAILKQRIRGIGENRQTPIFPKLVFLYSEETCGDKTKPNQDLFDLGIKCSRTRLYPDFLKVDGDNSIGKIYNECGDPVSPMGCRAFLGEYRKDGSLVVNGRANCGAVTINLPLLAIESKGDKEAFFKMIDKYAKTVFDIHEWTYNRLEKAKGSSNPLYYCEGGAFMKVGYNEPIKPIVEGMTASLGYIGLEETCQAMFGKPLHECQDFASEVMDYLWSKVEEYKKRDGRLYTLYSTPAESLIGRFQMINRKKHGVIKDVTSRDYMTNSFHTGVWQKHNPIQKMNIESPLFAKAHGGRIVYCEYPYNVDHDVLKQMVQYGMDKDLYQGVNIESCNCMDCGHQGEFETCPKCGSENVTEVSRCCGYLSFSKIKGDTRYNSAKVAEVKDRVLHTEEDRDRHKK